MEQKEFDNERLLEFISDVEKLFSNYHFTALFYLDRKPLEPRLYHVYRAGAVKPPPAFVDKTQKDILVVEHSTPIDFKKALDEHYRACINLQKQEFYNHSLSVHIERDGFSFFFIFRNNLNLDYKWIFDICVYKEPEQESEVLFDIDEMIQILDDKTLALLVVSNLDIF